jgi:hypothetical protein
MNTLLILFVVAAVSGGMLWFGGMKDSKPGLFVLHLLIGFACVEGSAHLLRMSDLAYIEAIRSSGNIVLLLVAVILLSGLGVLGLQRNKNVARFVHGGAGLAALLMVLSISRQL